MTKKQLIALCKRNPAKSTNTWHSVQYCIDEMVYEQKVQEVRELKSDGIEKQIEYLFEKGFDVQQIAEATGFAKVDP